MRLVTYKQDSGSALGIVAGEDVIDLSSAGPDVPTSMLEIAGLSNQVLPRLNELQTSGTSATIPIASLELMPVITNAPKIICVGLNYADHAKEGGNAVPDYPGLFMRTNRSMIGANAPIVRPSFSDTLDYEAELMVIIGKGGRHIAEAEALSHVFGYSIFNDGTVREFQRKSSQWTPGKNFDDTGAVGPWLVTPDELPPGAQGLKIESRLNGKVMQSSNTSNMICSVAHTISLLSQYTTLEVGDMIAMGTPEGVGYARKPPVFMQPGDVIEVEIEQIGLLRNPIVADETFISEGDAQ
jgi:2-keto-4-pentenoate hydratase/2-oxohepta-3-ene-1,7-dioic acid hydratase in catechol pathway